MNQTYIHLLITHLPTFGSIFGGFVLAQGPRTRCEQTKIAAYYIFIISAMGAGIAYLTGEAAEKTVENIQGVAEPMVEVHENFAVFAFVSFIILGISSIGGLILTLRKSTLTSTAAIVTMFI